MLNKILNTIRIYISPYYLYGKNKVSINKKSINIIPTTGLKLNVIKVKNESKLHIGKNVHIYNSTINLTNGDIYIADNVSISNADIKVDRGCLNINSNARIQSRIWIRFGGKIDIGQYTNINIGSELRADDYIKIGDFNQISYDVSIWDTNTHYIYSPEERREKTTTLGIGNEKEKPITKPIKIGNDCWIGKNCAILKGSIIGNNVILGYNTVLTGQSIADNTIVVPKNELKLIENKNITKKTLLKRSNDIYNNTTL